MGGVIFLIAGGISLTSSAKRDAHASRPDAPARPPTHTGAAHTLPRSGGAAATMVAPTAIPTVVATMAPTGTPTAMAIVPTAAPSTAAPPTAAPTYSATEDPTRGAPALTPGFVRADVIGYVAAHGLVHTAGRGATGQAIAKIVFTTSRGVTALLGGESPGLPGDTPLCYVELTGTFSFAGAGDTILTYPRGYEVFDVQTGNVLMVGGLTSATGAGTP